MPRSVGRHIDDPAAVGLRVREARLRAGLSQRELAFDGCSYAYISRIESGGRVPSMQVVQEFARRLGVSATYLATGDGSSDQVDPLDDADLAYRLGEDRYAEKIYSQLLEDEKAAPARRARALAGLGEIAYQRGETTDLGRDRTSAIADRLGRIYAQRGENERALAIFERELDLAEQLDDRAGVMRFATLLANAVLDAGNNGRAQELLARALRVADEVRDPLDRARLWWSQSRLHNSQGQPELAAHYARLALSLFEDTDHLQAAAVGHLLLAYIENERGDGYAALAALEQAEPLVASGPNRLHRGQLQVERARALLLCGEREEAAALAMGALPLVAEASAIDSGRAQALLAEVFKQLGEYDRAQELFELALETLPSVDRNLLRVYTGLAEILDERGQKDEALELLKTAMRVQQTVSA
jgi:tetratricopeptide (TPR) repeat protein